MAIRPASWSIAKGLAGGVGRALRVADQPVGRLLRYFSILSRDLRRKSCRLTGLELGSPWGRMRMPRHDVRRGESSFRRIPNHSPMYLHRRMLCPMVHIPETVPERDSRRSNDV